MAHLKPQGECHHIFHQSLGMDPNPIPTCIAPYVLDCGVEMKWGRSRLVWDKEGAVIHAKLFGQVSG